MWTLKPGHLKDCWITTFSENKSLKLTNNIHKSEDCFLRWSHSWTLNFIGAFARKNLENLLFSENVVTGQSSSKCPSWSVHTVIMDSGKWIKYWTRLFTKFCPVLLKFCLYQSFVLMSINKLLFVPLQLGFLWQVMLSKTFVTGH